MTRHECRIASLRSMLVLLSWAAASGACATVVGTAASPVSSVVEFVDEWHATEWWQYAVAPFGFVMYVGLSPVLAAVKGVEADIGFVRNGNYEDPPFGQVFTPWAGVGH